MFRGICFKLITTLNFYFLAPDSGNELDLSKKQKQQQCAVCNKLNNPPQDFKEFKKSDFGKFA